MAECLLRHDWVYRWRSILDMVGLEPTPALLAREKRLKELAELARNSHELTEIVHQEKAVNAHH